MSLRVWLPLTKDLRNQGLDDVTVTNNGATFNSAGKLGGCYSFDGNDDFISLDGTALYDIIKGGSTPFSITMWVYHADSTRAILFGDYSLSGAINFNIELNTSHSVRFYWAGSPDTSGGHTLATLNTWIHIAVIYDGTKINFYMNGELKDTYTGTLSTKTKTSGMYYIGRDSRTGTTAFNGKLNDFRIYDHALSQMEVKELSKGLVLHYPMADTYIEATTNLSNSKLSNSCYNAVTQKYSYGTNTDIYKESGTFEGRVCEKVHMGTNGLDAFPYVFFDYFQPPVGETRTLSFDYYPTIMDKVVFYTYSSPGSGNYIVNYKTPVSWSGSATIPVKLNQWNHIAITVTNTGSAARGYGYMQIGNVKHTSSTANYWLFGNIQIEAKDHATGYAGPNGTRNVSTVYDCSGFINNGTISGNLIISNDTPKYSASTQFNGAQYIQAPFPCGAISEAVSVAVWGYENNWNTSSAERLIGAATNSSGWCIGDYGSENTLFAFYANGSYNAATGFKQLSAGWHHFVITFDGLHLNYYVDGQPFSSKTFSTKQVATGSYNIEIGRHYGDGCNFKGRMSDARVYATALSADDVKSLYQNSAYIDSSGNVYGAVHSEV